MNTKRALVTRIVTTQPVGAVGIALYAAAVAAASKDGMRMKDNA